MKNLTLNILIFIGGFALTVAISYSMIFLSFFIFHSDVIRNTFTFIKQNANSVIQLIGG